MSKPAKEIIDLLATIRVLLTRGILDKREIISWADNEIIKTDNPEYYLIELSLLGNKASNEIDELLDKLSGNSKSLASGRAIIGLIAEKIYDRFIDFKNGFEILYSVQRDFELTDLEKNYINHAGDELELAIKQVWGDKNEVQETLSTFLKCYEGFTLYNSNTWDKISSEVNEKLMVWEKNWLECK